MAVSTESPGIENKAAAVAPSVTVMEVGAKTMVVMVAAKQGLVIASV